VLGPFRRIARRTARRTSRRAAYRDANLRADEHAGPPSASAAGAASGAPPYLAELEQLDRLRQEGIVSEEEFEAKKQRLLGL
jgi:predicted Zn-dependent peptidase